MTCVCSPGARMGKNQCKTIMSHGSVALYLGYVVAALAGHVPPPARGVCTCSTCLARRAAGGGSSLPLPAARLPPAAEYIISR